MAIDILDGTERRDKSFVYREKHAILKWNYDSVISFCVIFEMEISNLVDWILEWKGIKIKV